GGGYKDIGRVEVDLGWVPTPKINGYSDGLLYVSGKWSGLVESLSGQTVCRYGQTSGGPHCGTLDAILPYEDFSIGRVYHVARVIGGCTHHGDSGGPWLSGVGNQVQGTHIGGTALGTCPLSTTYTYYQPISDHVSAYGLMSGNVLTS